jgi:hypothetical protein
MIEHRSMLDICLVQQAVVGKCVWHFAMWAVTALHGAASSASCSSARTRVNHITSCAPEFQKQMMHQKRDRPAFLTTSHSCVPLPQARPSPTAAAGDSAAAREALPLCKGSHLSLAAADPQRTAFLCSKGALSTVQALCRELHWSKLAYKLGASKHRAPYPASAT